MRCNAYLTGMTLASPIPKPALIWMGIALGLAGLYALRALLTEIPPQDHVALSLVLCALLLQVGINLERYVLKISLSENRCWVYHHRAGACNVRSLPVSAIHSACLEMQPRNNTLNPELGRLVLITSLGMIPIGEKYLQKSNLLEQTCQQINDFLASRDRYLHA